VRRYLRGLRREFQQKIDETLIMKKVSVFALANIRPQRSSARHRKKRYSRILKAKVKKKLLNAVLAKRMNPRVVFSQPSKES